jgi:hypothetical protein
VTQARERCNERRTAGDLEAFPEAPAAWLVEHRALLKDGGRALDIACGDGRSAQVADLTRELLRAFAVLHVRHYREEVAERPGGLRGVARLVAQRIVPAPSSSA